MFSKNRVGISTVYMHDDLYAISKVLQPNYQRFDINGKTGRHGVQCLGEQSNAPVDVLVLCDEDCFISSKDVIDQLVDYVVEHDYAFAGVPDGGCYHTRQSLPFMPNNFFVVLNLKLIRERQLLEEPKAFTLLDLFKYIPFHMIKNSMPFGVGFIEPYYNFYMTILGNGGKPLWLSPYELPQDPISIRFEFQGMIIGYHSWFAREWKKNMDQTERIKKIIALAVKKDDKI